MTLKAEIQKHLRRDKARPPDYWRGADWWQVLAEEERVFEIEIKRWPHMVMAWSCYEIFLGIANGLGEDTAPVKLLEELRTQRPDILNQGHCEAGFLLFAHDYVLLTTREAHAAWSKMDFWNVRIGITSYRDDSA